VVVRRVVRRFKLVSAGNGSGSTITFGCSIGTSSVTGAG